MIKNLQSSKGKMSATQNFSVARQLTLKGDLYYTQQSFT